MKSRLKLLLLIDGLVNLLLGIILLLFPFGIGAAIGIPQPAMNFYPTILGGVLFGIGIALLLELRGTSKVFHGLGLAGAIVVNFCGAGVLVVWLIFGRLDLPLRGVIILWLIALLVFGIGISELMIKPWQQD
jgi:hypothetical protein